MRAYFFLIVASFVGTYATAHDHGLLDLNVSIDGNIIRVDGEIPGMPIFGFEHKPKNSRQRKRMEDSVASVKKVFPEVLSVTVGDKDCSGKLLSVDVPALATETKIEKGEEHSDIDVAIEYTCGTPVKAFKMQWKGFGSDPFKKISKVSVTGAGAAPEKKTINGMLNRKSTSFDFRN